MAIYIEYISRKGGVPLDAFHQIAGPGQRGWASSYGDDHLILNVGRTWRLGPEPEYVCIWNTPGTGVERLSAWASIFASGEADHLEKAFGAVGRIDMAGFYEPLGDPVAGTGSLYFAEYFDVGSGATRDEVAAAYEERRGRNGLILNVLCDRIGKLGPDPRGVAFWQLPGYDEVQGVATELDGVEGPVRLVRCGLYAELGQEVI